MVKLNELDLPVILKHKLLFGPGKWNDWNISQEEVLASIGNTEWNKKTRSLFYSHKDEEPESWVGSVCNEMLEDGKVYGDLKICDADLAFKLTEGEAPFAVSAGIRWSSMYREPTDFSYRNFSLVINPGMHDEEIYINFADKKDGSTFNEAKLNYNSANFAKEVGEDFAMVTGMEKKRKEMGLSVSQFYAAPRDPPSESALPIFDASHVRNALARFNQTKFLSANEKQKARKKIISAAKKFNIEISADFNTVTEVETEKESNFNIIERRLDANMVNEEKRTESIEEEKPETEVKEEVKEESEAESKEEVKEEAEKSTEADFSELKAKLDSFEARMKILEEKQANFSEELEKQEPKSEAEAPAEVEEIAEEKSEEVEEEPKEEAKVEEEEKAEEEESEAKADFAKISEKLDRVADALEKRAAPMSTAEFAGNQPKKESVTDRLTSALCN